MVLAAIDQRGQRVRVRQEAKQQLGVRTRGVFMVDQLCRFSVEDCFGANKMNIPWVRINFLKTQRATPLRSPDVFPQPSH